METENLEYAIKIKKAPEKVLPEVKSNNVCSRIYNEEASFSQVNFQTFQDILDKRNELLSTVKHF